MEQVITKYILELNGFRYKKQMPWVASKDNRLYISIIENNKY